MKWQYHTEIVKRSLNEEDFNKKLNQRLTTLGDGQWELVSASYLANFHVSLILKRPADITQAQWEEYLERRIKDDESTGQKPATDLNEGSSVRNSLGLKQFLKS